MRKIVQPSQDIFDVVLHHSGTLESIGDFFRSNPSIGLDEDLSTGQVVQIDAIGDSQVVNYYQSRGIVPANGRIEFLPGSGLGFDYELHFEFN